MRQAQAASHHMRGRFCLPNGLKWRHLGLACTGRLIARVQTARRRGRAQRIGTVLGPSRLSASPAMYAAFRGLGRLLRAYRAGCRSIEPIDQSGNANATDQGREGNQANPIPGCLAWSAIYDGGNIRVGGHRFVPTRSFARAFAKTHFKNTLRFGEFTSCQFAVQRRNSWKTSD